MQRRRSCTATRLNSILSYLEDYPYSDEDDNCWIHGLIALRVDDEDVVTVWYPVPVPVPVLRCNTDDNFFKNCVGLIECSSALKKKLAIFDRCSGYLFSSVTEIIAVLAQSQHKYL